MKQVLAGVISFLLSCAALAEEPGAAAVTPQPRLRLDATRQTAVTATPREEKNQTAPAVVMERLIVKERSAIPNRPPAVDDPTGALSPIDGGRLLRRDAGGLRFELGLWPHIDLFVDEARFHPTQLRITFDFLRIKF